MTILVLIGLFILGWGLGGFLKLPILARSILSGGLGFTTTATLLQIFWLLGIPFYALSFVWWLVVGSLLGWFSLGWWPKRKAIMNRCVSEARLAVSKVSSLNLNWQKWPLILVASICAFSLLLILVWCIFVRPVTWDNLSLYDSRARLLGQNTSFEALQNRYLWDYEAVGYDFIHPFGGSLVNALAYQVEGDFVAITVLPLFVSVLGIPFLLWKNWTSRWVFWLLLSSSRLLFEQAIEGYAGWTSALLWFLGLGVLLIWNQQREKRWLILAGIFFAATQTLRTSEPFWGVLSISWIIWQVWEKRTWKIPLMWQILPWLVLTEWTWVRKGIFAFVAEQFHPISLYFAPASFQASFIQVFANVLWTQRDFWPFFILLILFGGKKYFKKLPFFFLLLLLWLGVLVGGTGYLIWKYPNTGEEFVQAWPRASLPIAALAILLTASVLDKKETKRS